MEVFLKMVVPKMHCFLQEHPNKINDFGVPPLIFGNLLAWSAVFGGFQHVLPDGNGSVGQWVSWFTVQWDIHRRSMNN